MFYHPRRQRSVIGYEYYACPSTRGGLVQRLVIAPDVFHLLHARLSWARWKATKALSPADHGDAFVVLL